MTRKNDKKKSAKKAAKQPAKKGAKKSASVPTIRGDGGFVIGGEWTPRGDE